LGIWKAHPVRSGTYLRVLRVRLAPLPPIRNVQFAYQIWAVLGQRELNQMTPTIKQIVINNTARFSFYRSGNIFYAVEVSGQNYQFPVSLEDIGGATLTAEFKAITLMRYIRKALADGTFVKTSRLES
jgi:hypothetical protein